MTIPTFLTNAYLDRILPLLELSKDDICAIYMCKDKITKSTNLINYAKEKYIEIFIDKKSTDFKEIFKELSSFSNQLGQYIDVFQAIIFFAQIDKMLINHKNLNIDKSITKETLSDFSIWMMEHYSKTNRRGLSELDWLYKHLNSEIFKLGRLQYEPISISDFPFSVLINKTNSNIICMYKGSKSFRSDGQLDGCNGIFDKENSFLPTFKEQNKYYFGHLVDLEKGTLNKNISKIEKNEYSEILKENDLCLNVHIPKGESLTPKLVKDSVKSSVSFFDMQQYKAYLCHSWLLDSQLQKLLKSSSNILAFQKLFSLYPTFTKKPQAFERIFGDFNIDLKKAKINNSLEKSIKNFVLDGNLPRDGAGFISTKSRFFKDFVR